MTFDQWFENYAPTAPEVLDDCARDTWDACVEACAKVCDEIGKDIVCPEECAEAIRMLSTVKVAAVLAVVYGSDAKPWPEKCKCCGQELHSKGG